MSTLDQPTANLEKPSYFQIALNYGAITSLVLIAISLVANVLGITDPRDPKPLINTLISLSSFAVLVVGMVMAIQKHRDEDLSGFINFGRAFSLAMIMGLVVAVINSIFTYVYMEFIDPSIIEFAKENFANQMEAQGISEGDPGYSAGAFFVSIGGIMIFVVIFLIFQMLIAGLIAAAIGQKKQPQL